MIAALEITFISNANHDKFDLIKTSQDLYPSGWFLKTKDLSVITEKHHH